MPGGENKLWLPQKSTNYTKGRGMQSRKLTGAWFKDEKVWELSNTSLKPPRQKEILLSAVFYLGSCWKHYIYVYYTLSNLPPTHITFN